MEKVLKYRSVTALIEKGIITEFGQIFDIITLTKVARDLGTHTSTLSDLNDNPGKMKMEWIMKLSELFEVSSETMFKLIERQYNKKRKLKK
jgi:plasmid maintenance system antidote protein VapI